MVRIAATCLVLMATASASAGIEVRMEVTDRGAADRLPYEFNPKEFTSRMDVPTNPGEELLVHIYMKSDETIDIRALQVQYGASTYPTELMGADTNTGNQPVNGIPNFWFDYTGLNNRSSFPADGVAEFVVPGVGTFLFDTWGKYLDFSDLVNGDSGNPVVPQTAFNPTAPSDVDQINMIAGEWLHIGAMPIVTPNTRGGELMTLDLVTPTVDKISTATLVQHGFALEASDPVIKISSSSDGDDTLGYAVGARGVRGGPIQYDPSTGIFSIVPEPTTLALLAFGGIAALRRRRNAA